MGPSPYPQQPVFMMPPPGMFKPQRSFTRAIFTTLAGLILTGSIMLNFYLLLAVSLSSGLSGGQGVIRTVITEGDDSQQIAVVPIKGMIGQPTAEKFDAILTTIEKDPTIKGLVIEIETPGGGVTPSDQMYARVMRLRAQKPNFPVVITMGQLATSGGYYVACAGTHLIAQPTTMTGNIGVLMPRFNVAKLADKYGIEEATITAPHQGFKNAGSMFAPVDAKDTQYLQTLIDEMYGNFKTVVITGRGAKLTSKIEEIADGRVFTATQAKTLGLVDDIGYAEKAYAHAAKAAGLTNPTFVRYSPRAPSFFDAFSAESKSNMKVDGAGGVTINGINVTLDAGLLEELGRPRALYLWRGQ